jgi:hypothetical protein
MSSIALSLWRCSLRSDSGDRMSFWRLPIKRAKTGWWSEGTLSSHPSNGHLSNVGWACYRSHPSFRTSKVVWKILTLRVLNVVKTRSLSFQEIVANFIHSFIHSFIIWTAAKYFQIGKESKANIKQWCYIPFWPDFWAELGNIMYVIMWLHPIAIYGNYHQICQILLMYMMLYTILTGFLSWVQKWHWCDHVTSPYCHIW